MAQRFEYRRIEFDEFERRLEALNMKWRAYCRITGISKNNWSLYQNGKREIPFWADVLLSMWENVPGALAEARQCAAEGIVKDLERPELGEYPFLEGEPDEN